MAQPQTPGGQALPFQARAYVWLVAGLGVGVLAGAARAGQGLAAGDLGLAASLLVLGVLAQHFLLEVAPRHKIDMSLAADFAALLLFSPPAAVVLVGLAQALGQATLALRRNPTTGRRRRGLRGILFNTGQLVLATGLGALVYAGVGLPEPLAIPAAALALYLAQRQTIQMMARERRARTEAEAAERKAAMLAEQNARILAAVREAILKTDVDGRIEFANPAASQLIGSLSEELVGRRLEAVLSLTEGEHAVVNRCDGRQVPIEYTAARVADGDVVVVRDISLRLEAERNRELLARAEKLRALGQMASGVAHDLNQSLALISGYAHMAREGLEERLLSPEGPAAHLDVIVSAAHDGADTVRRLLAWTRTSRPAEGTLVDLEQLLPEVAHLTAPRWRDATQAEGHPIDLRVEVNGPAVIEGNSATLREALTNLVFNAVDAMPGGGSIALRARRSGNEVVVEVADTGPGIPPDIRERMFEPFFTTKSARGTGLGLAQVMAAVEQHHARIQVESAPGRGTTFRLVFPAASPAETAPAHPSP